MNSHQVINVIITIVFLFFLSVLFTRVINKQRKFSKKNKIRIAGYTVLATFFILLYLPRFTSNQYWILLLDIAINFMVCLCVSYTIYIEFGEEAKSSDDNSM